MPSVRDTLEKRVASHCSNPNCGASTRGPHTEETKSLNLGVAAHITAAAVGGPRFDRSLSGPERSSYNNGIWLCRTCGTLVDNDVANYPVSLLQEWKRSAEDAARVEVGKPKLPAITNVDRPMLTVSFAGGQERLEAERDLRIINRELEAHSNSRARRFDQMKMPTFLRLYLRNVGRAAAEHSEISVTFPKECELWIAATVNAIADVSGQARNILDLQLPTTLLHDPDKEVFLAGIYAHTPSKNHTYSISWKAHCRHMKEPSNGKLELFIVPDSA